MADFVYDKAKKTLTGFGQTWFVRSGIPRKYSPTPNGTYKVPKGSLMAGSTGHGVPVNSMYSKTPYAYRDKKGFSWFLWLGKGNLGIHPDGNRPGTKGCIGIIGKDTKPLFTKFKKLNSRIIIIQVK